MAKNKENAMKESKMEHTLKRLFDYQRFQGNDRLEKLILNTEGRYPGTSQGLSDEELGSVSAAGEMPSMPPKSSDMGDHDI